MTPLEELAQLLRPAGGGIHLVSTGRAEQEALQQRLYGARTVDEVRAKWTATLARIADARVVILGVPSDVGAGFRRGANLGPAAIRAAILAVDPDWPERSAAAGVLDIGDVFVVPQLLHDDMLGDAQKAASQRALYPSLAPEVAATLPVSPLSIEERALDLVLALNPNVAPVVIGGDHSTAWPVAAALSRVFKARGEAWGIVQPDAHTDLLEERLGVRYCFATWSYHANDLVGRGGRMVQVGIRATRHPREHWETTLGVRQFWADECRDRPAEAIDAIVEHLKLTGVKGIYFSNDIDGTDDSVADATGTPEPNGLTPEFVVELIRRLGRDIGIIAGDIMEVAPPLGSANTVTLAARYLRETIDAIVTRPHGV